MLRVFDCLADSVWQAVRTNDRYLAAPANQLNCHAPLQGELIVCQAGGAEVKEGQPSAAAITSWISNARISRWIPCLVAVLRQNRRSSRRPARILRSTRVLKLGSTQFRPNKLNSFQSIVSTPDRTFAPAWAVSQNLDATTLSDLARHPDCAAFARRSMIAIVQRDRNS